MRLKEFDIMLDIKKYRKNEGIELVQADSDTNIFNITLYDGVSVYSPEGLTIEIAFAKPDGTTVLQSSTDEEKPIVLAGNKIICTLKTNTIAAPGKVLAEVRVLEYAKLLTSARFEFYVRRSIVNDETVESTNEFPVLAQLITTTQGLIEQVNQIEKQVPEQVILDINAVSTLATQLETDLIAHYAEIATSINLGHVKKPGAYVNVTDFLNGWTSFAQPQIRKDDFNVAHLYGTLQGGITTAGTILLTLPLEFTPEKRIVSQLAITDSGSGLSDILRLDIRTDRTIRLHSTSVAAKTYIALDVRFYVI